MPEDSLKTWVIMFTDMKDYTAKSSLFTNKQISDLLDDQEVIISENVSKNNWKIIKSLWDWYMLYFEKSIDAINTSLWIFKSLNDYNKNKNMDLFKIHIRVALDYWEVMKKDGLFWNDYFWTTINIVSRLQEITSVDWIFVTKNLINNLTKTELDKLSFYKLWEKVFKWIFDNIIIYELLYKVEDIELLKKWKYTDDTFYKKWWNNHYLEIDKKVNDLIFKVASIWAIISTQPIPFIDTYNLLALQLYILKEISNIYWIKLNIQESKDILIDILKVTWGSYLFWQGLIWITKVWLPVLWWYVVIPITFWITYWFWKVINTHIYYMSLWKKLPNKEIKALFTENLSKWKKIWKEQKKKIIEIWNENKNIFIKNIKEIYEKYNLKEFLNKIKVILFKKINNPFSKK